MNNKSAPSPALLDKEIYQLKTKTKLNIAAVSFGVFCLAIFIHFPLREFIKAKIVEALASQRSCPIFYESIDVSFFFLPSVAIENPTIDARCLPNGFGALKFEQIEATLVGPSFLPPGLRIRTKLKYNSKDSLTAYWSQSFNKGVLRIPKTIIDGNKLSAISSNQKLFEGKIEIEALAEIAAGKLINMDMLTKSSNLKISSANISGFNLPNLNLETLFIKVSSKKPGQITIEDGLIGNDNGPISVNVAGNVDLNLTNLASSRPDLKGKIKFSNTFLEQFSIIKLLLSSKIPDNGYYSFELLGSFNAPNFKFL